MTYGNVTVDLDRSQFFRQKRAFEERIHVEANKFSDNVKPTFFAAAYNFATEKMLSHFEVYIQKLFICNFES